MILLVIAYVLIWILLTACILSTSEIYHDTKFPYMKMKFTDLQRYFLGGHLFGLLWNIAFIHSLSNFVITAAVCVWYYNGQEKIHGLINKSFWMAFRYHLGTIAFGSFILAIVWVIRIIVEYLYVSYEAHVLLKQFLRPKIQNLLIFFRKSLTRRTSLAMRVGPPVG